MKKILFFFFLQGSLICSAQLLSQSSINTLSDSDQIAGLKGIANNIYALLYQESFDSIPTYFTTNLAEELNSKLLATTWNQIVLRYGKLQKAGEFKIKKQAEGITYLKGLIFEKGKLDLSFQLNKKGKITSFYLKPYQEAINWQIPAYSDTNKFSSQSFLLGKNNPLLAELCLPKGIKNPLIVVLVQGSGPNDMDETMGPNKIFKDIAEGLASNGIGALRYNKRTYDYPAAMNKIQNKITVEIEVVNDAIEAIKTADSLTDGKVILLGHSLGGYLAPKIAEQTKVAGVIVLAGNVSPIEDLLISQLEYLIKNDSSSQITEFQLNTFKWQVSNLKIGNYDSTTTGATLPMNLPASYWLTLKDYNPTAISKKQEFPYLILNGGRDYQVNPAEAEKWKNGNQSPQSKTIIYPKLNHLFYAGEGLLLPKEYEIESHFDEKVLKDIVQWIDNLN